MDELKNQTGESVVSQEQVKAGITIISRPKKKGGGGGNGITRAQNGTT